MVRAYQESHLDFVVNVLGRPHIVLEDSENLVALYMPEGAPVSRWDLATNNSRPLRRAHGDSVQLLYPGQRFAVSLFYETGSGPASHVQNYFPGVKGRFYGWKVDLVSPFARTEAGFDMIDDVLDICVRPDRSCDLRDEDEMARLVELGVYSVAEAEELRDVGREVIEMIEARLPPFDDGWQTWRPTPDLVLGEVMADWAKLPLSAPYQAWAGPLTRQL